MSSTEQGKNFMNSLQRYINSVKPGLSNLQEPFKVYETEQGVKRVVPSTNKECKEFSKKYGSNEVNSETSINTPFGKCSYKSKTDFEWNPNIKTPMPDGFYLKNKNKENSLDLLNKNFNRDILKYTRAFNEYNEQLIKQNYATDGSTAMLLQSNNDLVKSAENIYNSINLIEGVDKNLNNSLKKKKEELYKSILELKEQQKKLQNTRFNNDTLDTSFYDNKRLSQSTNLRYMLYLVGSLILIILIYKINTKNILNDGSSNIIKLIIYLSSLMLLFNWLYRLNENIFIIPNFNLSYIKYFLFIVSSLLLLYFIKLL